MYISNISNMKERTQIHGKRKKKKKKKKPRRRSNPTFANSRNTVFFNKVPS